MFKKRSSKNKSFVITHHVQETMYHDDTIHDSQAPSNTSSHPLKPTISLPLFDDEDFVSSRNKNLKRKTTKISLLSSTFSKSLPIHKSPTPSNQPIAEKTTSLQDTIQQIPTFSSCDISIKSQESSSVSSSNEPTLVI
jgi:hypothetical protein